MDTALKFMPETLARRAAAWAALETPEGHRKDAFNEAYKKIVLAARTAAWESPDHRRNWAYTVARRACIDYCRSMHLRVGKLERAEMPEDLADGADSPSEICERSDAWAHSRARLRSEIRKLPPGERRIMSGLAKGRSLGQIAADLGVSASRICQRAKLANARIKAGIDGRQCNSLRARLSPRQREVLALIAAAKTDKEIAAALGLSAKTVEDYVGAIYAKLGARNRVGAVLVYLQTSDKNL